MKTFLFLALIALLAVTSAQRLDLSLTHESDGVLTATLTNNLAFPVEFAMYDTPFDHSIFNPIFLVVDQNTGAALPFTGPRARRAMPPPAGALIRIEPGQTIANTINLREIFELVEGTNYAVEYLPVRELHSTPQVQLGKAAVHNVSVRGPFIRAQQVSYDDCSSSDIAVIQNKAPVAMTWSDAAFSCIVGGGCNSTITKWFGSKPEYNYLSRVYDNLGEYFRNNRFNYACRPPACAPGVYAYVYPGDPRRVIHLCNFFFVATDEQVLTLVHEASHFSFNSPGTDDIIYGRDGCLNLAKTSSYQACHNADNVCYFSQEA